MERKRVEPRGHAMLDWNRAESVFAAQKGAQKVGAGIPSRMGDGFEGSSQNSSAFHHFGLYCSYSWGERKRRVRITRSKRLVVLL